MSLVVLGWLLLQPVSGCDDRRPCEDVQSRDISPDGRFEIVTCRLVASNALPGQSADAPGLVQLQERGTGHVLQATRLEMIQLMPAVQWSAGRVSIPLVADWDLPYAKNRASAPPR
jgi:hypothetical protein